jgi:hypothetical protein
VREATNAVASSSGLHAAEDKAEKVEWVNVGATAVADVAQTLKSTRLQHGITSPILWLANLVFVMGSFSFMMTCRSGKKFIVLML